jgi:L-phenylalanine/L-methionine N-acetyltransferase
MIDLTSHAFEMRRTGLKDITIRHAIPGDAEGCIAHMMNIASELDTYVSYTPDEANVPLDKETERIRRDLEIGNLCVLGQAEGRIIAQLGCVVDRSFAITRHTAVLGMSVDRNYRNQGIGSALLERAINWAKEQGIVRLELEVYAENLAAIHLYEKFGFGIEGRKQMYAYQRGRYYDSYLMARLFR